MNRKSHAAAGHVPVIGNRPSSRRVSFLLSHVARGEEIKQTNKPDKQNTTTPKVQGNNIKCSLMAFFTGGREERDKVAFSVLRPSASSHSLENCTHARFTAGETPRLPKTFLFLISTP